VLDRCLRLTGELARGGGGVEHGTPHNGTRGLKYNDRLMERQSVGMLEDNGGPAVRQAEVTVLCFL